MVPSSRPQLSPIRRKLAIALSAAALLAAASTAGYLYTHRAPKLTDKDTILLADFQNTAGDPIFNDTLRQGLEVQLQESPFLSVISDDRIQKTLEMMGKPKTTPLIGGVAREVCDRTNSAALLDGSISSLGAQYVLGLRAIDCRSGAVIHEQQVQVARKEDVIGAITKIAAKFRSVAGESLATVERYSTPLDEAATPSLEALKEYSLAGRVLRSRRSSEGVAALPTGVGDRPRVCVGPCLARPHVCRHRRVQHSDSRTPIRPGATGIVPAITRGSISIFPTTGW